MSTPVTVYAWDLDPSIDPLTTRSLNKSILIYPFSHQADPTGYAATLLDQADAMKAAGKKAAFRVHDTWTYIGSYSPRWMQGDYTLTYEPFEPQPLDAGVLVWTADFISTCTASDSVVDYLIFDNERDISFYTTIGLIPDAGDRQTYYDTLTSANAFWDAAFPSVTNPFLGQTNFVTYGTSLNDQLIRYTSQFSAQHQDDGIEEAWGDLLNWTVDGGSNYKDAIYDYPFGDSFGRPLRQPYAQVRFVDISAPSSYITVTTGRPMFSAEAGYTTTEQQRNRQRVKKLLQTFDELRSAAAGDPVGRLHPWITPPGYAGTDYPGTAGGGWCSAAQLPFEKLLWRVYMDHLLAMGINTYILWNANTIESVSYGNPNYADTDAFCDEYFEGLTVGELRRDLPEIGDPGVTNNDRYDGITTLTTGDIFTDFDALFGFETFYYAYSPLLSGPNTRGTGMISDPYLITPDAEGEADLSAMLASIELVQGAGVSNMPTNQNPDDQLFAAIKETLDGVSAITAIATGDRGLCRDDWPRNHLGAATRLEYNPLRFEVGDGASEYRGLFGITVHCDRANNDSWGGADLTDEGKLWTLESLVIAALSNTVPTVSGYGVSPIEWSARRRPTIENADDVTRRLNFLINLYPGGTVPLFGNSASLTGLGGVQVIQWYVSVEGGTHGDMTGKDDTATQTRIKRVRARLTIRAKVPADAAAIFPAVGSRQSVTLVAGGSASFVESVLIQSVVWDSNQEKPSKPQYLTIRGVIDGNSSGLFTGTGS